MAGTVAGTLASRRRPRTGCCTTACPIQHSRTDLVAYVTAPDAFEEDCRRALLIVTTHDPPPDCAATVIGRKLWRERGALALRRAGSGFVIGSARPANFDLPWSPAPPRRARMTDATDAGSARASDRSAPRDATPRPEDIEADQ